MFTKYSKETVTFLQELSHNNSKEWFDANRLIYDTHLLGRNKEFVIEMGEHLQALRPEVKFIPKVGGSLFRINRDTRFSKNKSPYKTHFGIFFWEGVGKKMENPGFYFHVELHKMMTGVGFYKFSKRVLAGYRKYIMDDGNAKALSSILEALEAKGFTIGNKGYKRTPKGMDKASPYVELYLFDGLYAGVEMPHPSWMFEVSIVDELFAIYERALPLQEWMVAMMKTIPAEDT